MDTNAAEIERALRGLAIAPDQFRRLPEEAGNLIYQTARRHFVPHGQPRWWWEHFPTSTSAHFSEGDGFSHLVNIVPDPQEVAWFIAEDFVSPEFSVWEANAGAIQAVLGECYHFEYYLIQKQFRWLLCENHHAVMVAVGAEVETKLRELKDRS